MDDINQLRKKIDDIDKQLLELISHRVQVCRLIGALKKEQNLPISDPSREQEVYKQAKDNALQAGLNPIQIETIYREIVNMCSAVQK
ncbi:MAG: chorismate mutase [Crenarchaeota archaeon]|nr:chorismate mutase [Thermoproteota archaeon]